MENQRWLLWGHDIYGPESGRTREYCALMADVLGVTCIIPDFFRGEEWPKPVPTWESGMQRDWAELLVPYLQLGGAQVVGAVGTCFGSYVVMHSAAESEGLMVGGVSIHPSHPPLMANAGEDETTVYQAITSPQYFMDTPDSADSVRPGGLASTIIESVSLVTNKQKKLMSSVLQTQFDEYEAPCEHGFFNRGDLNDPVVANCVNLAIDHMISFLNTTIVLP